MEYLQNELSAHPRFETSSR